jgi:hypothetical protein
MQKTPQSKWELARLGKITSSEVDVLFTEPRAKADKEAGVLSDGAMTYVLECAAELLTGTYRDIGKLPALEWGNTYEPIAADLLREEYPKLEYFGKENPEFFPLTRHSGGSPDALVRFPGKIVFEIKSPENPKNHIDFLMCENGEQLKDLNRKYWSQLQMNMVCVAKALGCSVSEVKGVFVSYCPIIRDDFASKRLHQITVYPDRVFCEQLMKKIARAEEELSKIIKVLC